MRRLARSGRLALFASALGCSSGPAGDDTSGGESGETGPEDEYEPPVFIDPASGTLTLSHHQLEGVALRVSKVVIGRTRLEIDGRSVGTLIAPGPVGSLEPDALRLQFDGALVKGTHSLRLVTPGTTQLQVSTDVEIRVKPSKRPTLSYELGDKVLASGEDIGASGVDDGGLLLVVSSTGPQEAELSLLRSKDGSWNPSKLRTLTLPGHVSDGMVPGGAVAASVLLSDDATVLDRVRVAWRVGSPGAAVDALELEWGADENVLGDVERVLEASEVADAEWASIQRPAFTGSDLVIGVHAPADTEQTLPGDEALFAVRWPELDSPDPAFRIDFGALADIEVLGPAIDLARGRGAITLRMDRRELAAVQWAPGTAYPELLEAPKVIAATQVTSSLFDAASVQAALGGQTIAAITDDGGLRLILQNTWLGNGLAADPDAAALPAGPPSGAIAATVLMGSATFLVPYGNEAEVVALLVDGETTQVQTLDNLFCDQIALPASTASNVAGSMSFACLQGGEVRLGALFGSLGG